MHYATKLIITLLTLTVFAGVSYFGFKRIDRFLDLKAIQDCTSSYRQEITNQENGIVTIRPLEQQARECAIQKGVKNWDGIWSDLITQ